LNNKLGLFKNIQLVNMGGKLNETPFFSTLNKINKNKINVFKK